jgi:hypothetical protein
MPSSHVCDALLHVHLHHGDLVLTSHAARFPGVEANLACLLLVLGMQERIDIRPGPTRQYNVAADHENEAVVRSPFIPVERQGRRDHGAAWNRSNLFHVELTASEHQPR